MAKTATIRARIEPELKWQAEELFSQLGLSVTQAITLFYKQVTLQKGLPFAVKIPERRDPAGSACRRATGRASPSIPVWRNSEPCLEPQHRQHRLSGRWSSYWECHIEPDWLLIRGRDDDLLTLVRTGTHCGLFG